MGIGGAIVYSSMVIAARGALQLGAKVKILLRRTQLMKGRFPSPLNQSD